MASTTEGNFDVVHRRWRVPFLLAPFEHLLLRAQRVRELLRKFRRRTRGDLQRCRQNPNVLQLDHQSYYLRLAKQGVQVGISQDVLWRANSQHLAGVWVESLRHRT